MACCQKKCICNCPQAPAAPRGEILFAASTGLVPEDFIVPAPLVLTPFDEVPTSLNPVSSPEFLMPAPGRLMYVGTVARVFDLHGQVTMRWAASEAAPSTTADFFVGLIITPPGPVTGSILSGIWINDLTLPSGQPGEFGNIESFHTQALVRLNPNDIVQIGISASRTAGEAETVEVSAFSLMIS